MPTSFSIAFVNCNGLNNKLRRGHMKEFIQKYDFVGLNEARVDITTLGDKPKTNPRPNCPVDGYTLLYEPEFRPPEQGPSRRTNGGVGLLVRNELMPHCERIPIHDRDSVWCHVSEYIYGFDLVLGVQYIHQGCWRDWRVPGKGGVKKTERRRQHSFKSLIYPCLDPTPMRMLVLGDFNAFIYSQDTDGRYLEYGEKIQIKNTTPLQILNFHDRFREKGSRGTCHQTADTSKPRVIDYALASEALLEFIDDFQVLPFSRDLSDYHSALEVKLKIDGLFTDV
ncbi:hypothetical protein ElyMa_003102500 [Elysia marginata]|uniref:Endonuclease/exonuclease/phosphatase domain-containing protein n=1 Tax=Elysia marginata TaxID=1093978 RepID=A0AAV4IRL4_9GAST|nr:hypothetical protein ElyMa_003102500 [Elysia marginata]